ncbi:MULTISPECIES: serine/threonine-protein kinase [unclassified Streptomyces]|uniref:serine/threonine-protein kinase n=1 Tax=unclassified Streptomyces TaxID=2593676 RepID=UPI001908DC3B|nr:serine/threonine-protein kinase [Streptomyces sp. HSG2]
MRPVGSKYLLEQPIGRGATGTVWRARQRETAGAEAAVPGQPGETVAIKVLKEELAGDPDIVMRFLRERSVLLRLTHPNIVRVRDLVVEGDVLALVMDLVDGPDLHRHLRENGPFTPVAAALLTAQIADALAASHADGVVHRDLKPANVLLRQDDGRMYPMLTDFGIARLADSPGLTRTHEFVGTPAYVAPESAEGRPQTSAVDVYGAGVLLYELLTGRPPFSGATALEMLHQHLSAEPSRPPGLPDPLWTVVERCLRKNPGERPGAENLARGLRVVAEGVGVHADAARIGAAERVGSLLVPDPAPAPVPEAPGAADATQVLPRGAGSHDAAAATSVLPHTGGPAGATDPTTVMPPVPPMPPGPPGPAPSPVPPGEGADDPHPWQNQLRAARDRNEQTQVQYLDPAQDPLRRRPQRQVTRPQGPPPGDAGPPRPPRGYGYGPEGRPQPYAAPQPQPQVRPEPRPQAPRRRAEPPPRRLAPPPAPEPRRAVREPREPRPRGRGFRIPGLGCLKGCLVTLVVLVVAGWLIWELSPLQGWIGVGKGYWDMLGDWVGGIADWVGDLGGTDPGAGGAGLG